MWQTQSTLALLQVPKTTCYNLSYPTTYPKRCSTKPNHYCYSCLTVQNQPHLPPNLFTHGLSAAAEQAAPISFPCHELEVQRGGGEGRTQHLIRFDGSRHQFQLQGISSAPNHRQGRGLHTAEWDLPHSGSLVACLKRISSSPDSSHFKRHLDIYPFISQLGRGGETTHSPTHQPCMVPKRVMD